MNILKGIWMVLWILFYPEVVFNQDINFIMDGKESTMNDKTSDLPQEKLKIKSDKPLKIYFFTGTNYLFSKAIGSAGSIYFGANAFYPVTPKFTLEFGASLNYSDLTYFPTGFFPETNLSVPDLHSASLILYTRGSYFLSSRLTLSGMAFKRFSPYHCPSVNPDFLNFNQQGMSLELNYRLFQNLHIGAQFNFTENRDPFYPSRLTQPVFDNYYW
jgi:hypothetical protein